MTIRPALIVLILIPWPMYVRFKCILAIIYENLFAKTFQT